MSVFWQLWCLSRKCDWKVSSNTAKWSITWFTTRLWWRNRSSCTRNVSTNRSRSIRLTMGSLLGLPKNHRWHMIALPILKIIQFNHTKAWPTKFKKVWMKQFILEPDNNSTPSKSRKVNSNFSAQAYSTKTTRFKILITTNW